MNTAQTIINQLGGNRFLAMTGAKHLVNTGNGLRFKLPRGARDGVNCAAVTLNGDLYDVQYLKVRGLDCKTVSESTGVYADGLAADFTQSTGLSTSL